jgi:hypothetical protein
VCDDASTGRRSEELIDGLDDVEGLPPGSFALMWKTHHAAIDGASGVEILNVVHDLAPVGERPAEDGTWRPEAVPPAVEPALTGRRPQRRQPNAGHAGHVSQPADGSPPSGGSALG